MGVRIWHHAQKVYFGVKGESSNIPSDDPVTDALDEFTLTGLTYNEL